MSKSFSNFNQFRKGAVGLKCKIIKSEAFNSNSKVWSDVSTQHKYLNFPRTIEKVSNNQIAFLWGNNNISSAFVNKASKYAPTPNGFTLTCEYSKLVYEFVEN